MPFLENLRGTTSAHAGENLETLKESEILTSNGFRSSHGRCSREGCLKCFVKFIGKHLCQSLIKLPTEACNFIKKQTGTDVFLWILWKCTVFTEYTSWRLLLWVHEHCEDPTEELEKQSPIGVLSKCCFEKLVQIRRKTSALDLLAKKNYRLVFKIYFIADALIWLVFA